MAKKSLARGTAALLCALIAALVGCSPDIDLVLAVGMIPAQAKQLRVLLRANGTDAQEQPSYELPATDLSGGYRIGLHLPQSLTGSVTVSIAALSGLDDQACILATTYGSIDLSDKQLQLLLNLDQVYPLSKCIKPSAGARSIAQEAHREQNTLVNRIHVDGWGFQNGTQVFIDDLPATGIDIVSGTTINIVPPAVPIPTGSRNTKVAVKVASGEMFSQTLDLVTPVFDNSGALFYQPHDDKLTYFFSDMAVGDLNGDGKPDLVLIETGFDIQYTPTNPLCSVFINNGAGSFPSIPTKQLDLGLISTPRIALVDVNNDNVAELLIAQIDYADNASVVVLSYNDGKFTPLSKVNFAGVNVNLLLAPGKFRGSPQSDIVVVAEELDMTGDHSTGMVYLLTNDGSGTLIKSAGTPMIVDTSPTFVVAGDFDGDARLDIAIQSEVGVNHDRYKLYTFRNNGNGSTFPFAPVVLAATLSVDSSMAVSDLDKDNKQDLILSRFSDDDPNPTVLISNGTTFQKADAYSDSSGAGVAAGDFNRDGLIDMAISDTEKATLAIYYNTGMFSAGRIFPMFSATATSPFLKTPPSYPLLTNAFAINNSQVIAADVNGDGKLDLITLNPGDVFVSHQQGSLQLFLNLAQ